MRIRLFTVMLGIMCVLGASAYAPTLDGTMMPYDFASVDTVAPWGEEMTPVYVAYVARHGARYLSSEKKVTAVMDMLEKARKSGSLTDAGRDFMRYVESLDSANAGKWGALSDVGIAEEQRLGAELVRLCPGLFSKAAVNAEATYVPRVVMTMYELSHQLVKECPDVEISAAEGKRFNPVLRFFTTDSAYADYLKAGPWKAAYDKFVKENIPVAPALRILGNGFDYHELQKFSLDAYGLLQSAPAIGMEGEAERWYAEDEYYRCWEVDNLKHYYQRSVSRFSELPAESAGRLLEEMMTRLSRAESGEEMEQAHMWFGHAETVMPLFAAMKLPGCYAPDAAPEQVASRWKDWEVSPLGANLMIVLLKDDTGKSYVSLCLNGRWVSLSGRRVVSWNDFQEYVKK